jgi:hypothetical protein
LASLVLASLVLASLVLASLVLASLVLASLVLASLILASPHNGAALRRLFPGYSPIVGSGWAYAERAGGTERPENSTVLRIGAPACLASAHARQWHVACYPRRLLTISGTACAAA